MAYIKRKPLRIANYDYNSNGVYFLTFCTRNREKLLGNVVGDGDLDVPQVQLSDYGKVVDQYVQSVDRLHYAKLLHYVVMPNHFHAILEIFRADMESAPTVMEIVQSFKRHAVVEYIRAVKEKILPPFEGTIWQRSFYDHVIRNEEDYRRIAYYIENNPLAWELDELYIK